MIRPLKSKDLKNFIYYCKECNNHDDFYITKDNKRYFLNNATIARQVFYECIKWNNKCYVKDEEGVIKGIILVVGYKDKYPRKYVKILAQNKRDFQDLFNYLDWQKLKDLFIKVNINNSHFVKFNRKYKTYKPAYILRKTGFRIIKIREDKKEILLKKEERRYGFNKHSRQRNNNNSGLNSR